MKIQNQCERCRADVALIDGKPVLRLYDDEVLYAQMDAGRIQKVTISPTGQARVVVIPTPSPAITAADYGLVIFGASVRVTAKVITRPAGTHVSTFDRNKSR